MIMEGDKSRDLQLASWRPRRATGVSSSLKACTLKTKGELMFQFTSEGRKEQCPSWSRRTEGAASYFLHSLMCPGNFSRLCLPHIGKPVPHLDAVEMPGQAREEDPGFPGAEATISLPAAKPQRSLRIPFWPTENGMRRLLDSDRGQSL